MKKDAGGRSILLRDNSTNEIIANSKEMLSNAGIDNNYIDFVGDCTVGLLNDYADLVGEGTEIEYSLKKRMEVDSSGIHRICHCCYCKSS